MISHCTTVTGTVCIKTWNKEFKVWTDSLPGRFIGLCYVEDEAEMKQNALGQFGDGVRGLGVCG